MLVPGPPVACVAPRCAIVAARARAERRSHRNARSRPVCAHRRWPGRVPFRRSTRATARCTARPEPPPRLARAGCAPRAPSKRSGRGRDRLVARCSCAGMGARVDAADAPDPPGPPTLRVRTAAVSSAALGTGRRASGVGFAAAGRGPSLRRITRFARGTGRLRSGGPFTGAVRRVGARSRRRHTATPGAFVCARARWLRARFVVAVFIRSSVRVASAKPASQRRFPRGGVPGEMESNQCFLRRGGPGGNGSGAFPPKGGARGKWNRTSLSPEGGSRGKWNRTSVSPGGGGPGEVAAGGYPSSRLRWPRRSRKVRGRAIRVGGGAKRRRRHYIAPSRMGPNALNHSTADLREYQEVRRLPPDRPPRGLGSFGEKRSMTCMEAPGVLPSTPLRGTPWVQDAAPGGCCVQDAAPGGPLRTRCARRGISPGACILYPRTLRIRCSLRGTLRTRCARRGISPGACILYRRTLRTRCARRRISPGACILYRRIVAYRMRPPEDFPRGLHLVPKSGRASARRCVGVCSPLLFALWCRRAST